MPRGAAGESAGSPRTRVPGDHRGLALLVALGELLQERVCDLRSGAELQAARLLAWLALPWCQNGKKAQAASRICGSGG